MNDVPDQRALDLVRQIEGAFAEMPYPGDDHLVEGHSGEAIEIADFLRGRHWRDLSLNDLLRNRQSIFFMTPEAIRFYLPAYLLVSVRHYEEADTIPASVLFLIKPSPSGDPGEMRRFHASFGPLTGSQREVVKEFLLYMRDEHAEDFVQAREATQLLESWSAAESGSDRQVETTELQPKRLHPLLTILGIALTGLGAIGLVLTFWSCGLDPSRWFIITAGSAGKEISGWTIVAILIAAIVAGLFLLVLSRGRKRGARHITQGLI